MESIAPGVLATLWYHHNHTPTGMWTSSWVKYRVKKLSDLHSLVHLLSTVFYANQLPFEIELGGKSVWKRDP